MKKIVLSLVLSAFALGATNVVHAQTVQKVEKPFAVKLGVHFSPQGNAKSDQGTTVFAVGVDYAIAKSSGNNPVLPNAYFDYAGGSKNGGHLNTYGLGVALKAYANAPSGNTETGASFYYGGGVGVYVADDKYTDGLGASHSKTNTNIGGKLLVGAEFSGNYFIEANYTFIPKIQGADPSGPGVAVGLRF